MKYVKILRENEQVWGVLDGSCIKTLKKAPYNGVEYDGTELPLDGAKLVAPCDATKIVAIGKNYYDHALEFGGDAPDEPIIFMKPTTCVNNPDGEVVRPNMCARFDYEGEIAVIIKKTAKKVKKENALEYILGYTCLNDITARDIQQKDGQWTRGKGFDGCAPIGPAVSDELAHDDICVMTRLNGQIKQNGNSKQMMWDIPSLIEYVTACMTLLPGDVLTTGTPVNVGPMVAGDIVEIEIPGVGVLRSNIIAE